MDNFPEVGTAVGRAWVRGSFPRGRGRRAGRRAETGGGKACAFEGYFTGGTGGGCVVVVVVVVTRGVDGLFSFLCSQNRVEWME